MDCGLSLPLDGSYADKGLGIQTFGSDESEYPALYAYFQYVPALDALNGEMEQAAAGGMTQELFDSFMERAMQHYKQLAFVYAVPAADYEEFQKSGGREEGHLFSGMEKLGSRKDVVYLASYEYQNNSTDGMSDEEKALYDGCVRDFSKALRKAKFIDLAGTGGAATASLPSAFPSFRSTDVQGNAVSQEIFSRADLTVVNVWGTFCGPCIQEMPSLAEWASALPDGVQLVGLVCDVGSAADEEGLAAARSILDKAGASFVNVLAGDDLQEFLANIQFVPTTFLVDRNGVVVGEPIVGASIEKFKKAVGDYLSQK